MGEIGIEKILLIMVVVLLLFGAKRIPEIGSSPGARPSRLQAQFERPPERRAHRPSCAAA